MQYVPWKNKYVIAFHDNVTIFYENVTNFSDNVSRVFKYRYFLQHNHIVANERNPKCSALKL